MSKKKKEEDLNKEKVAEDDGIKKEATKEVNVNNENITLDKFIKSYGRTSGEHNSYAAGFKVWYTSKAKENMFKRMILEGWVEFFNKYLSSPVK